VRGVRGPARAHEHEHATADRAERTAWMTHWRSSFRRVALVRERTHRDRLGNNHPDSSSLPLLAPSPPKPRYNKATWRCTVPWVATKRRSTDAPPTTSNSHPRLSQSDPHLSTPPRTAFHQRSVGERFPVRFPEPAHAGHVIVRSRWPVPDSLQRRPSGRDTGNRRREPMSLLSCLGRLQQRISSCRQRGQQSAPARRKT